jgi:peptidyl-prolyl cis-trans isomerase SurA
MRLLGAGLAILSTAFAGVILDRIAIVVDGRVIKDSDITREIRVTDFLNGDPLSFTAAERKKAASRLIDQALIAREVSLARYSQASPEETAKLLDQVQKQRFKSEAAFKAALSGYGITAEQLRQHLAWQITVINFIEARFRPGVLVTDEDIEKYFESHKAEFQTAANGRPVSVRDVRDQIVEQITGERVNREFFKWLDAGRQQARIEYHEPELQ